MASSDPNVTITFSGQGEGALRVAYQVGEALDSLALKSKGAQRGLQSVAQVMDIVASRSVRVNQMAVAYQGAANGITAAVRASTASADAFAKMAQGAAAAQQETEKLNRTFARQPRVVAPRVGGAASPAAQSVEASAGISGLAAAGSVAGLARMAAATVGLSVGLGIAGNEARSLIAANADLDASMSRVAAVGGLQKTGEEYQRLLDLVIKLGGTTRYSAVEAADGLKELIAAGYSAADAGKLLADTLDLAATENMGMGRASEIVVAGLQSMRLGVDQSTRLVNVLARAANASTSSVDGMGEALKFVAPVAASLGISLEDVSAAIAIMANNGVQAGLAGRGLSSMISRMIGPTVEAKAVLDSFGVSLADINPSVVGLGGAFKALQKVDNAGLVKLFGAENLDISNIAASNADAFAKMSAAMSDAGVSAKSMSTISMDNLSGDGKKLLATIQELRVELGKNIYADLRGYVQGFTGWLKENKAAIVDSISAVAKLTPTLLGLVAAYVALRGVNAATSILQQAAAFTEAAVNARRYAAAMKAAAMSRDSGMSNTWRKQFSQQSGGSWFKPDEGLAAALGAGTPGMSAKIAGTFNVLGQVAVAAIAGWEIGTAIEQHFKVSERWVNWLYQASDAANDMGNRMNQDTAAMLNKAKDEIDLEQAKLFISEQIATLKERMTRMKPGSDEYESSQLTLRSLEQRLRTADKTFSKNQQAAKLEAERAAISKQQADAAKAEADAKAEAALAEQKMKDAAKDFMSGLPDLKKSLVGAMPVGNQITFFEGMRDEALGLGEGVRRSLEAALKGGGVDLSLIQTDKEIRNVDELIGYYQMIMASIQSSGKTDLFGAPQMLALTEAVKQAMEARSSLAAKEQESKRIAEEQLTKDREIASVRAEIAINEAKAAGDTTRADKLEREKKILEEQQKLIELMGKDREAEAKALATSLVDSQIAAQKPKNVQGQVVADSLREIGGGGRVYFGGQDIATQQLSVQQQIATNTAVMASRATGTGTPLPGQASSANGTKGVDSGAAKQIDLLSGIFSAVKQIAAKAMSGGGMSVTTV